MATWVLEHDVFADGDRALADAVLAAGGEVVSWEDGWWLDDRWPRRDGHVVFHGSLANADRVVRELPWVPGAFCATERFACSAWWPMVADELVSPAHLMTTVAALVRDGAPPAFGTHVFVRPDSALKPFGGRVLPRESISLASLDHGFYYVDETIPVAVTPVVEIGAEWRFVVAGGEVVSGSGYTADGRAAGAPTPTGHEAASYAAEVVARLSPPNPVFVVDVCETPRGLRLLELNPFSGADLYGCDRDAVVGAVHSLVD